MAIYSTFFICGRQMLPHLFPGWRAPLAEPVVRESKNPFTGELTRVSTCEPDWSDTDGEEALGLLDYEVVAIEGDYQQYLEGRLPAGVRDQPHWCAKGLTEVELSPLGEAAGVGSALGVALYGPPSLIATLDEVNSDLALELATADDLRLEAIAAGWAATMSTPEYTHSSTGEKLCEGWLPADALDILRPLLALLRQASAEDRLYLLTEA